MFQTLINPDKQPDTWQKIPWHDPEFSRRMLKEHLDQSHNLASRPQAVIATDVRWIQQKFLPDANAKILDIGCGPSFYSRRFAENGHIVTGVDFSPASIAYAKENDAVSNYHQADVRDFDFGEGYDLIMMIHGELNAFSPDEAQQIIRKAHHALKPGGKLLLEVHHHARVRESGNAPSHWYRADNGLFSDEPYLCLVEADFAFDRTVTQFYVFTETEPMAHYITMLQAYSDDEYRQLLDDFAQVNFYPMAGTDTSLDDLFIVVATK